MAVLEEELAAGFAGFGILAGEAEHHVLIDPNRAGSFANDFFVFANRKGREGLVGIVRIVANAAKAGKLSNVKIGPPNCGKDGFDRDAAFHFRVKVVFPRHRAEVDDPLIASGEKILQPNG